MLSVRAILIRPLPPRALREAVGPVGRQGSYVRGRLRIILESPIFVQVCRSEPVATPSRSDARLLVPAVPYMRWTRRGEGAKPRVAVCEGERPGEDRG